MGNGYQKPVDASSKTTTRQRELGTFLRSRRERITPASLGLPVAPRRRAPGLLREEVAQQAGIGVTWYTWLEQGRDIRVSERVLEAVARTLRLDRDERAHLFALAGATPPHAARDYAVDEPTRRVLDAVLPYPACVQNAKYDLLAHNRTYARLIGDLSTVPEAEHNSMWLTFTDPAWRAALPDWDVVARRMVAQLRAHTANHLDDPTWQAFIRRLKAASPDFERFWDQHEVTEAATGHKPIRHPWLGILRFDVATSWLAPGSEVRLLVFTPADRRTATRLARLTAD
jgi:transcriptional regulator with XRE-family HTH domain